MGTRNLTVVKIDGQYKVAQYCQWNGYPDGQGLACLTFLRDEMDVERFKKALRNTTFIDPKDLATLWKQYGADDDGWVSSEGMDRMRQDHPEFSRNTGAEILGIVQSHPEGMELQNSLQFASDDMFCQWAWVIDFDTGTFEGYAGRNRTRRLTREDRFYALRTNKRKRYCGVVLEAKWSLDNLPSDEEFLAAFETAEDDI